MPTSLGDSQRVIVMDLDYFIDNVVKRSTQQRAFIHFIDRRNLPSIRQRGLLSTQKLREMGINIPAPGGNEWSMDADRHSGMDAYVHLCFKMDHPMEYCAINEGRIGRRKSRRSVPTSPGTGLAYGLRRVCAAWGIDPVLRDLRPARRAAAGKRHGPKPAISDQALLITGDVSNKNGVLPEPASQMLDEIDLEVLYSYRTKWKDPVILRVCPTSGLPASGCSA